MSVLYIFMLNLIPFPGDLHNPNFLASVVAGSKQQILNKPQYECGVAVGNPDYFPWQASIYLHRGDEESYLCEGTLISPTHILTAAHCLTYQKSTKTLPESQITVYLGRHFFNAQPNAGQIYKAAKINVYPVYRPESLRDDLAIIELSGIPTIKDNIRPICLAKPENKGRNEGVIIGYGFNEEYHDGLTSADVVEISPAECVKRQPDWRLLVSGGGTYCVKYVSALGHCVGNSGTSLTQLNEDSWELRGVVTIGAGVQNKKQCDRSSIVLATDVSKYLTWITSVTSY